MKPMQGTSTDCHTGEVSQQQYGFRIGIDKGDKPNVFFLLGGPTGYESFYMHEFVIKSMRKKGWTACAGTKDEWDKLSFSPEEMSRVFDLIDKEIE